MIRKLTINMLLGGKALLVGAMLFSGSAQALVVLQQFSLPLDTQYDTNPLLVDNKQSIWRFTATPTYTIAAVNDTDRWFANANLGIQRSSNKLISEDRQDPNLDIGWEKSYEKGTFRLVTHYDKRSSRFTEFTRNGIVDSDGTAVNRSVSADLTRMLTERLNFTLGGQYSKSKFSGSGFTNSVTKTLSSSVSYDWNEKLSPFIRLSLTDYKPDGTNLSRNEKSKNILFGSKILINPNTTLSPSIGVNSISGAGAGWIADNNLSYIDEKSTLTASIGRAVSPNSLGSFQTSNRLNFGYSYLLSENSSFGASLDFNKSKSTDSTNATQFSVSYSKVLSDMWQMRLTAQMRNQKNILQNVNGNVLGITFTYSTPEF